MAKPPTNPSAPADKPRRDLEQEMLMREVDDAVRTDQVGDLLKRYGVAAGVVLVLALAALGGFLWWQGSSEGDLEGQSETLVGAIDEYQAGNYGVADEELAALSEEGTAGAMSAALMIRAGAAIEQGRLADAVSMYQRVIDNQDAPKPLRDAAQIRLVSVNFDEMEPQDVLDRLAPFASAESPWFGSAGELVAAAYLDLGREEDAGQLLVQIAQDEDVPDSIRARSRQLAGFLGYDAIEDVDATLEELRGDAQADLPAQ